MSAEEKELKKITSEKIACNIIRNRNQKIPFKPGYDGVYGIPMFDAGNKKEESSFEPKIRQKGLGEFFVQQ